MNVARIFFEADGYHISDDSADHLDARGAAYKTKADAFRAADLEGFTHYVSDKGTEAIPAKYRDKLKAEILAEIRWDD